MSDYDAHEKLGRARSGLPTCHVCKEPEAIQDGECYQCGATACLSCGEWGPHECGEPSVLSVRVEVWKVAGGWEARVVPDAYVDDPVVLPEACMKQSSPRNGHEALQALARAWARTGFLD